jgi:hypothetical protein
MLRPTQEDMHTQWVMHHHRFFKGDGYTVNITQMALCLNIEFAALMTWVKQNYPERVSSSLGGAGGLRVNVGMPALGGVPHE